MSHKEKETKKSILKSEHEHTPNLGSYNLYAKRASFKDDVLLQQIILDKGDDEQAAVPQATVEQRLPIASDEPEEAVTAEEKRKRKEFHLKRKIVDLEGAEGLDLKAVLAHRIPLTENTDEEEDEDHKNDETSESKPPTSTESTSKKE